MEQKLGRRLEFNEIVHHKNGNKRDNVLSNLEIVSRSKHISMHPEIMEARLKKHTKYFPDLSLLKNLFLEQKMSARKIGIKLGVPTTTVNFWLRKFKIKRK